MYVNPFFISEAIVKRSTDFPSVIPLSVSWCLVAIEKGVQNHN
jgi:hypothetical protein